MASVRFSDVVRRVNKFVDRHNTDLLYYVGGEHMESQELLVRQKGLIKGATIGYKFHFGFEPGHILFGSRNPHLKKCSMVDFAGVCSDSTYVVETRDPEVLDQRYLLLEMQSDRFWDWAEENKSGSVNYLINYCTLDEYEFDLPPIEKQRELAELLWAANDLKEAYRKAIAATDEMLKAKFREMFMIHPSNLLGCIRDLTEGKVISAKTKYALDDEFDYIDIASVAGTFDGIGNCFRYKLALAPSRAQQCVQKGDVLMSTVRPNLKKMAVVDFDDDCHVASTGFCVLRPKAGSLGYIQGILVSDEFTKAMMDKASGTTYPAVRDSDIMNYEIPIPPIDLQRKYLAIAKKAYSTKSSLAQSIADLDQVMKGLINESA